MTMESEETMATAEQCRAALESLTARIAHLDGDNRAYLADRTLSLRVSDLGITFVTQLSPEGAGPITQAANGAAPAQVRFTAKSDDVVAIAADPGSFARAWLTGRLKVEGSIFDLLRLRKLM
jgi:predicted lipid carrier protein YhbT